MYDFDEKIFNNFDTLFPPLSSGEYLVAAERLKDIIQKVPQEIRNALVTAINETRCLELVDAYKRGFNHGAALFASETTHNKKVIELRPGRVG
ncbi:hypothetical protein [Desulfofundulus thermocisternus]|uniref:hypothetical protein n=1 Tax=Desulfofundulus thermocisternus TaxID=42471 RepID=UPI00217CD27C|nr:hypothetical protein [Desulfofundulus thermocisternus]MCS5696930.1 hypothetical protein [Desulfofundulus thermocisternus]